jgi:hypothetical protein
VVLGGLRSQLQAGWPGPVLASLPGDTHLQDLSPSYFGWGGIVSPQKRSEHPKPWSLWIRKGVTLFIKFK